MEYRVKLSPSYLKALLESKNDLRSMAFVIPIDEVRPEVMVRAGDTVLPCSFKQDRAAHQLCMISDPAQAVLAMNQAHQISFKLKSADEAVYLAGWQRANLPARQLSSTTDLRPAGFSFKRPAVLPAIEIRSYRDDGSLISCGF